MGTWRGSMLDALAATLGRPAWWSIALAAFLVRGGILLILLPIVALPTPAAMETMLSPTVNALAFGGLTATATVAIAAAVAVTMAILAAAGLAGTWLDRALLREAALDEDLDLRWEPAHGSLGEALALRLAAHVPTLVAFGYATFRLISSGYDEVLLPGDVTVPLALRIVGRALDAVVAIGATWLVGEAIGGLATRRAAAGAGFVEALVRSVRQLLGWRGLATLTITTLAVATALAPFLLAVERAWDHLRVVLLDGAEPAVVASALLVLVASWILGLAILGAALTWRAAAWTAEVAPLARRSEPAATVAPEATKA